MVDYGIIRQTTAEEENDLIALPFKDILIDNFNDFNIEVLHPEYTDGKYFNVVSNQLVMSDDANMRAGMLEVKDYDYIIAPCSNYSHSFAARIAIEVYENGGHSSSINTAIRSSDNIISMIYFAFDVKKIIELYHPAADDVYLCTSVLLNTNPPVIALKKK